MIVEQYTLAPENLGLLAIFFPQKRVVRDPLPFFIAETELVVVSERIPVAYEQKKVIQVSRILGKRLDSRDGCLEFLTGKGMKVAEEVHKDLLSMEEEDFWKKVKLAILLGHFQKHGEDEASSVFEIFSSMFESFDVAYKVYRRFTGNYKPLFSALLTMMAKTQLTDTPGISPGYKKVLLKNRPYYHHYRMKVLEYLETEMTELDFVTFLADLSESKRAA